MAGKKQSTGKRKIKVDKLKRQRGKVQEMTTKDTKRVKGGDATTRYFSGIPNRISQG